MLGVLHGFTLILGVIAAGYLAALFGVVKGEQRLVLNRVAFYVATPALLFGVLYDSDPNVLLSPVIVVTTVSAVLAASMFVVASRLWFPNNLAHTTLGATCAGYVNSNNLGLPVAVYILGDAAYVTPLLLVQLVLFAPVVLAILESTRDVHPRGTPATQFKMRRLLRAIMISLSRAASHPIILSSVAGFVCALLNIPIPHIVLDPVKMIGAAAIPMVLMSFGVSLRGQRALAPGTGRATVFVASSMKVFVMPAIAWGLGVLCRLDPHELLVATTIAALPTAQNVYNYAASYRQAEIPVRDTVLLTTFASLPVIAALAGILGTH